VVLSANTRAQWLNFAPPGTPKTSDGRPDLKAATPRMADGKPDLSGTWMHELTSADEMKRLYGAPVEEAIKVDVPGMEIGTQHKYAINIMLDVKPGESSITPQAAATWKERLARQNPADVCREIPGFPLAGLLSEPIKIIQAPTMTVVLYEAGGLHRQVYSDARSFPQQFEFPAFLGYSVGSWDGDVFVVETRGFNDKTPLDVIGHPHSEALRVTERFHRIDFGHMDIEMTFDDPQSYTKPFTVKIPHTLLGDQDIFEMFCENEKDREHLQNANKR
jgi:hypothetical protein